MSKEAEFSFASSFITPCSIFDILSLFRCLVSLYLFLFGSRCGATGLPPRMEDTVIREVFGIEIRISETGHKPVLRPTYKTNGE